MKTRTQGLQGFSPDFLPFRRSRETDDRYQPAGWTYGACQPTLGTPHRYEKKKLKK